MSRRKASDFYSSFSQGSAEDFEHYCDSCLTEGQHVEANGYCLDCSEYLCSNCFRYHKKTKASRNHQLLDKNNMSKHLARAKPVDVCTEKCSIHKIEVIKFFCPEHEELGCHDCMTMNHRTCKLDYIPDICAGIADSDEYRETVKELDQKMKEADAVLKKAEVKENKIDESHERVIQDIARLRKEINDHLDSIQKEIKEEAIMKKAISQQEVNAVVKSCTKFMSNMKKLKTSLQNGKAADRNGQLFIDIKRAKSELQSGEIQQAESVLEKTRTQVTFNRNKDLENVLAVEIYGNLTEKAVAVDKPTSTLQTFAATPRRKGTFNTLHSKLNITLGSDCHTCISGCVVLASGKLVLADNVYSKLLVVNTDENIVTEEKNLDSCPWDIAVLPDDQIVVTVPDMQQILIMIAASKLSIDRSIPVGGACWGIIYNRGFLRVLCWGPYSIHVLDMNGCIRNTISLDKTLFSSPNYIVMSRDHSCFFISNYGNNSIVSVTSQGAVSAVYMHKDLCLSQGMLVLDDGSLLVCCCDHTIHHVSADLIQCRQVMDGVVLNTRSICYSSDRSEVYIGGTGNQLQVYSVCCIQDVDTVTTQC